MDSNILVLVFIPLMVMAFVICVCYIWTCLAHRNNNYEEALV
jgi:hypothetical protein